MNVAKATFEWQKAIFTKSLSREFITHKRYT